jgi:hypothetical protein
LTYWKERIRRAFSAGQSMIDGGFSLSLQGVLVGFFGRFLEGSSFVNEATATTARANFPRFPTAVASLVGQLSKLFLDGP